MLTVGAGVAETLATLFTDERLLATMEALVLSKVVLVFEGLAADVTREWTLT